MSAESTLNTPLTCTNANDAVSMDIYARDIIAVLDSTDKQPSAIYLVGHSIGAAAW